MTKIQRVKKVCKWLIFIDYAENDADLAKKLGYTKSSFSQIMNEKVPLSDKFVNILSNADKNINLVWVIEGEGLMLKNEVLQSDCNDIRMQNVILKENIELYVNRIALLEKKLEDCEAEKKRIKTIS